MVAGAVVALFTRTALKVFDIVIDTAGVVNSSQDTPLSVVIATRLN